MQASPSHGWRFFLLAWACDVHEATSAVPVPCLEQGRPGDSSDADSRVRGVGGQSAARGAQCAASADERDTRGEARRVCVFPFAAHRRRSAHPPRPGIVPACQSPRIGRPGRPCGRLGWMQGRPVTPQCAGRSSPRVCGDQSPILGSTPAALSPAPRGTTTTTTSCALGSRARGGRALLPRSLSTPTRI